MSDDGSLDSTVHLIRDLIDTINSQNDEAALLFLDQENAFDRVDHKFLYKTMKAFGIGQTLISWVNTISSNATSKININVFFLLGEYHCKGDSDKDAL